MKVPDTPDRAWHDSKPGPGCSFEDLRWYCIREIGNLQEASRASGKQAFAQTMEIDLLKGQVGTKADAKLVQDEFDKVRAETRDEMVSLMAEVDIEGLDAKFATLTDGLDNFAGRIQLAFQQVEAVEQSFQAHVGQAFGEAVTGLKWLHTNSEDRFTKLEADLAVTLQTIVGSAAPGAIRSPPVSQVPSGSVAAAPGLRGCAAGPFACGQCGPATSVGPAHGGPST
jgi:hypothetical protein